MDLLQRYFSVKSMCRAMNNVKFTYCLGFKIMFMCTQKCTKTFLISLMLECLVNQLLVLSSACMRRMCKSSSADHQTILTGLMQDIENLQSCYLLHRSWEIIETNLTERFTVRTMLAKYLVQYTTGFLGMFSYSMISDITRFSIRYI